MIPLAWNAQGCVYTYTYNQNNGADMTRVRIMAIPESPLLVKYRQSINSKLLNMPHCYALLQPGQILRNSHLDPEEIAAAKEITFAELKALAEEEKSRGIKNAL